MSVLNVVFYTVGAGTFLQGKPIGVVAFCGFMTPTPAHKI